MFFYSKRVDHWLLMVSVLGSAVSASGMAPALEKPEPVSQTRKNPEAIKISLTNTQERTPFDEKKFEKKFIDRLKLFAEALNKNQDKATVLSRLSSFLQTFHDDSSKIYKDEIINWLNHSKDIGDRDKVWNSSFPRALKIAKEVCNESLNNLLPKDV